MMKRFAFLFLVAAIPFASQAQLNGQVLLTESFDYADGDLSVVSGGAWVLHSGAAPDIQVVSGSAVVTSPGNQDNNRLVGSVMGTSDTWYYAVRFTVEIGAGTNVNADYFIHLKDETSFGYNARLALAAPDDTAEKDFSLEIWASSGSDGKTPWVGDFNFGEEIIAVVGWNNGTGVATLWVNPTDINSTNVSDDELADAMRNVESIALRQDSGNSSEVTIPVLSVGTDFDAVLAEVTPDSMGGVVTPATVTTTRGTSVSGTEVELSASDNMDYSIRRSSSDIQSRTEFTVKAVSPLSTPTVFDITLEGSVFARSAVNQIVELFNYDTSAWEQVDTRPASRFSDASATITPTGDLSRFVESGTDCIEARVRFQSVNPRQNFTSNTDLFSWTIN